MTFYEAFIDELDKLSGAGRILGRGAYRARKTPPTPKGAVVKDGPPLPPKQLPGQFAKLLPLKKGPTG